MEGGRHVYEIFKSQQNLKGGRGVKVEVHSWPTRTPDDFLITENLASCSFSVSVFGQLIPHRSDRKGGLWRYTPDKYYAYLSEKFMRWRS
jgi:hypothetical protein